MVSVPGLTDGGKVTSRLVEFVDVFPTLVEAAGLPSVSQCPHTSDESRKINSCTEGTSFMPLVRDPNLLWKSASFSQYPRMTNSADLIMGYSIRTDQYRYTEWLLFNIYTLKPRDVIIARELYDHSIDPNENVNMADKWKYQEIIKGLHKQLSGGWPAALPKSF